MSSSASCVMRKYSFEDYKFVTEGRDNFTKREEKERLEVETYCIASNMQLHTV